MTSELLPLFPLPSVVLFPGVFLPLHIFESRYREMVADALETDRLIGIVLLQEQEDDADAGAPPIFAVGCTGLITHCEPLDDGRYNIILRGIDRFRVVREDHTRAYRRAVIETLPEPALTGDDRTRLSAYRSRVEALLAPAPDAGGLIPRAASAMNDDDLINVLSQYPGFDPVEKQALLETTGVMARAAALAELLEMKLLFTRAAGQSPAVVH